MSGFLRRVRGAIGMGLTWAVFWGVITLVIGVLGGIGPGIVMGAIRNAIAGFIAGGSFSAVLSVAERGKRLEDLSLGRFAAWGGLVGIVLTGVIGAAAGIPGVLMWRGLIVSGLLGAGSASGTLGLARKGDPTLTGGHDRSRLEGG